jgi:LysM repeat protein
MIAPAMVRKSARYVAPIALAAVAVATYVIVHEGLNTRHATASQTSSSGAGTSTPRARRGPKFYTVKAGDTLSAISIKTHIAIYSISSLNPNLSPNSLQTGQRLRLRR